MVLQELTIRSKAEKALRNGESHIIFGNDPEQLLVNQMLTFPLRQFVIDKIKAPIMNKLIHLAKLYPESTPKNCKHPNSHVWLRIWNKFLAMEGRPSVITNIFTQGRWALYNAIRRAFIAEHEHDDYHRDRMQVIFELWLEEVLAGNWKPRSFDHPRENWNADPNVRGIGYEFLKERFYHPEKYKETK